MVSSADLTQTHPSLGGRLVRAAQYCRWGFHHSSLGITTRSVAPGAATTGSRLEQRCEENPPVDLQREQARKAWEAEIAARNRVNIDYPDAISNVGESWLEQMQHPTGANLILLLMDPIHIASILQQFEKLPLSTRLNSICDVPLS